MWKHTTKNKRRTSWWNDEVKDEVKNKKQARKKYLETNRVGDMDKSTRKEVEIVIR